MGSGIRPQNSAAARHLDMIEKVESTPHYRAMHAVFSYRRQNDSYGKLHNPKDEKDKADRQSILDYLNHYELVSIGIRKNILDAEIYKEWMSGPFIRDWNAASDFIQRERWKWDEAGGKWSYRNSLFENYQATATDWSAEARILSASLEGPPKAPGGPGDERLPDNDSAGNSDGDD